MAYEWIAQGVKPPEVDTPQQAMSKALTLRALADEGQVRRMEIQQKQQDFQDDQTSRQVLAQYGGNLEQAFPALAGKVSTKRMMDLQAGIIKAHQERAITAKNENEAADIEKNFFGNMAVGVRDSNYDPNSFLTTLDTAAKLYPQYAQHAQQIIAAVRQNPDTMKQLVDQAIAMSPQAQEALNKRAQDQRAQQEENRKQQKFGPELEESRNKAVTSGLDVAGRTVDQNANQDQYTAWRAGLPASVQSQIPPMYSPAAVEMVKRMGIPVKDQPEYDIKARQAQAMSSMKPEDWDAQVDNAIAPNGDTQQLNARTKALVRGAIGMGLPLTAVQAVIKDASDQIGKTETGVRTAKATAPIKIEIAQDTAAARAKGQQQAADNGPLTDDDYKRAGAEFAITGVMPALGNGSGPVKQRLIHEKMEFARQSNLTPRDMALAGAAFKGDSKSLGAFQTQRDQIVSFEQTAQKNLDLFLKAAHDIPDTGVPWLNLPLRQVTDKMAGSANIAAVNAARQVANNEIAKVTSGGGMSGVLSDSARHEVESYNPKDATFRQTLAVAKILKADMANRHKSMDDTLTAIRGRIGTFGAPPAEAGQSGGTVRVRRKSDGVTGTLDSKDFDPAKYEKVQ